MSTVLQIKSSIFDNPAQQGISSQLGDELVARLRAQAGATTLLLRDFSTDPVPYFDHHYLQAIATPAAQRSAQQVAKIAYSDTVIAEVQQADVLVIGVPMYNFAVPAMLKSWTDHLARAGLTFRYTETGSEGLLKNKKVYLVLSTGGQHAEGVSDFMRPYLRTILNFLGLTDIEMIVADGLNMGSNSREEGLRVAREQIENVDMTYLLQLGVAA